MYCNLLDQNSLCQNTIANTTFSKELFIITLKTEDVSVSSTVPNR